ncbi:hypothetical protein KKF70_03330 [bacterium]|nr:hypothetical protein [Candidatus Omnitrophota bacterium]MBU2528402.1 hypothetical protein [bacterium]MBU3930660.1 hypothetical protein [bacterium]MBU4123430.1 hypothetical protein [bacterium]
MSINKTRGFLYWLAKLLGDINAVQKGKVGKRIIRRAAGKGTGGFSANFLNNATSSYEKGDGPLLGKWGRAFTYSVIKRRCGV